MNTQRWKFTVEYDGSPFYGWQRQDDVSPTIQGTIEDAIFGFCQQRITIHVAGRTDAGVHARGQVFHVDLPERDMTPFELHKAINAHLYPKRVSILSAEKVGDDFHARFSATNKLYTYRILRRSAPPALESKRLWHFRRDLDADAMREGAKYLLGTHDFTTFRDSECQAKSPVKTLDRLEIETIDLGHGATEFRIHAEAKSFLHHQVRNMVGTLTLVGDGKWKPDDMKTALEAKDRTKGGPTAPPEGLYLVRVDYP
ncbi:MAG: tRNA pseudouridine(38-40) synthase TruA [Alphaproteobacteria bacterium]|nr:tRNA pseudouridine(38-40) synthase TruA [Alphaproteobacteria bacterium]